MAPTIHNYTPSYDKSNDTSLQRVSAIIKEKKQNLKAQLEIQKQVYKQMRDKNNFLMFFTSPTIIIPASYYFMNGVIRQNLSFNRRHQCDDLIEIVDVIGTTTYYGQKFIRKEFQRLFKLFKSEETGKLMSFLVEIYRLHIEAKGDKHSLSFIKDYVNLFSYSKLEKHLIPDIANIAFEYTKDIDDNKASPRINHIT